MQRNCLGKGREKRKPLPATIISHFFFPSSHEKKEEERGKGTLITKKWEKVPNRHLILPYRQSPWGKKKTVKEFRPRFIHLFLPSGENCLSNVQENKQVVTPLLRIPQARKRDGGNIFLLSSHLWENASGRLASKIRHADFLPPP